MERKKSGLLPRQGFEQRAGRIEVAPHRFARRGRVARVNGGGDRGVLLQRRAHAPWRRHSEPARPFQMDAQGFEDVMGARHPETSRHDLMERHVERVERGSVVGFNRRGLAA